MKNGKKIIMVATLTLLIAFMDISGIPGAMIFNIQIADIEPTYFSLMINFLMIGLIAFLYLKFLCPDWRLGLGRDGLACGMKEYGATAACDFQQGYMDFGHGYISRDGI